MKNSFLTLFESFFQETLAKWIPGLEYRYDLTEQEILKLNNWRNGNYDEDLRCKNHCIFINKYYIQFYRKQEIRGIDRALIDWTIGKAYQYSKVAQEFQLAQALEESIPRFLIASYLSFPALDLNNPWKQFGDYVHYFGATRDHYEVETRDSFNHEELAQINDIFKIIYSVEKFAESTNEGSKFPFSLAVTTNKTSTADQPLLWSELIKKQFIRSLCSKNILFVINEKGEYFDYKLLVNEDIPGFIKSIIPNIRTVPGDENFANYITIQQFSQPDHDVFILSVKENGDIFLYKNYSFNFFKRKGVWYYFNYNSICQIINKVSPRYHTEMSTDEKPMYYSAVDCVVSTIINMLAEQIGCCIGIIPPDKWELNFKDIIIKGSADYFLESSPSINQIFWKNDIEIRKKLLSIDGAVLIDSDTGKILGVGTIIPNNGDASEGARTVATKRISELGGLAIKISDDGYCSIYEPADTETNTIPYIIGK